MVYSFLHNIFYSAPDSADAADPSIQNEFQGRP
jgi:hypothetical protein